MEARPHSKSFDLEIGYEADIDFDPGREDREIAALTQRFAHRAQFFAFRIERRFGLDPQWRDDLVSSGHWGLFKALRNRRRNAHDRELSAYVSKRVEGAVIDEARRVLNRVSGQVDGDLADLDREGITTSSDFDWDHGRDPLDPEHITDQRLRRRRIRALVEHLDPEHGELLSAYAEGRSIAEIAKSRGVSPGRLQNQMTRIARQLRAQAPELRRLLRYEV